MAGGGGGVEWHGWQMAAVSGRHVQGSEQIHGQYFRSHGCFSWELFSRTAVRRARVPPAEP